MIHRFSLSGKPTLKKSEAVGWFAVRKIQTMMMVRFGNLRLCAERAIHNVKLGL